MATKGVPMTRPLVADRSVSRRWPAALLAATYQRCVTDVAAAEYSDPPNLRFAGWLAGHWSYGGQPEPIFPPDAVSVNHHGVQTMRWYAVDGTVHGYPPGTKGHYVVPTADIPPTA
ncbi:MAG: hypothetical protein QOF33_3563 [Thermomicrobiales bacterium]|nr:hypothetical protein [Thermomicrobiales bacterium]MEA2585478.1 hypothetical protein [Thermomicrobiales bacterium]MEA2597553.1 hypothetical protein [Thermomicrobiales bacterium]